MFHLLLVSLLFSQTAHAYTEATCPSSIPAPSRVDCYPEQGATESACNARGCMWCEYNNDGGTNVPWCFHDDTVSGTSEPPSDSCSLPEQQRVDCYPEAGSSQQGCYSRSCNWCESNTQGVPWCYYPDGQVPTGGPSNTGCPTNIVEDMRIDCWPGGGATQAGCESIDCIWCESSFNGVPWCFYNTTNLPEGIPGKERVDCVPEGGSNPAKCQERGCVFAAAQDDPKAPMCYFPTSGENMYGYSMQGMPIEKSNGYTINLEKIGNSLYGDDIQSIVMDVTFDSNSRIHWKFYDPNSARWEVPLHVEGAESNVDSSLNLYNIEFFNDPAFSFKVTRKSSGAVLWDTSLQGFTFSNQFLQIATRVPSDATYYGFGEAEHQSLKHDFQWNSWGMYARDQPPDPGANLYGVHPFYVAIEADTNTHGVLLLNSNAQDITFSPAPGLIYRTTGGVFDFYMFLGPEPISVIEQYNTAIGKPFFPPYWSLGFQLCRYGYGDLDTVKATVARMQDYGIPQDVQYGDIDYMDEQRDFTYDHNNYAGLPDFVTNDVHGSGMHYVIILDPCITVDDPPGSYPTYDTGSADGVFVMTSDNSEEALGKVWPPGNCAFPDYSSDATINWWTNECKAFHDIIAYDGLWIDMNEPANFVGGSISGCAQNSVNNPPFVPGIWGGSLYDKTMCPDFRDSYSTQYDTHSLYGWFESNATIIAAYQSTGKRPFVISRSTFPGSGKWSAHWLGDNNSDWHDLRMSIIGMIEFNMFGIPYVGADICGFNGNVDEELCERWMELGAFYPYSRNHNGLGYKEQDPASFGPVFAQRSKDVLYTRYTLLPYLYTLFYHSSTFGSPVVLPLSFVFTSSDYTLAIDQQFMWGEYLLISPVLYPGVTTVDAYFPADRWYDYYTGTETGYSEGYHTLSAPRGTIPLHVRGGSILPTQQPDTNTEKTRKKPMGLIIAMDANDEAYGNLYWDDGDSLMIDSIDFTLLEFFVANGQLTTTVLNANSQLGCSNLNNGCMVLGSFRLLGVGNISSLYVNDVSVSYTYQNGEIKVGDLSVPMSGEFNIRWYY